MSLIAKDTQGEDFVPLSAGMHQAVCYGVVDLGTQPSFGNFPPKRKVCFLWEVPGERIEFTKDGVKKNLPRAANAIYTLTLASKGNLRPMLESWRGRQFTPEELNGFDLKTIIGANCLLNIVHANGKGDKANRVYANVSSVSPLMKGQAKIKPENPTVFFSIDDCGDRIVPPDGIPDWLIAKILQCEENQRENPHQQSPTDEQLANVSGGADEDVPF